MSFATVPRDEKIQETVSTHAFDDRARAARWDRRFLRFEAESLASWPEVHERFGLVPELGRKAFANHPTQG